MGNRVYLYLQAADDGGRDIAEAKNGVPPVWKILLARRTGPPDDFSADRAAAEERMFRVFAFLACHPLLTRGEEVACAVESLRAALAALPGHAYTASLYELFSMREEHEDLGELLETMLNEFSWNWTEAETAMAQDDFGTVARLYDFDPADPLNTMGFQYWDFKDYRDEDEDAWLGHELYQRANGDSFELRSGSVDDPLLMAGVDSFEPFEDGYSVAFFQRGKLWGVYDRKGRVVMEPALDDVYTYEDGAAAVVQGGRHGYLNGRGKWLIAPQFDDAFSFFHGHARVMLGGAFGLIDRRGEFVLPPTFAAIVALEELPGWQATARDGKVDIYRPNGKHWFAGPWDSIESHFEKGDAIVGRDGRFGLIQWDGKTGLACEYERIELLAAWAGLPALYKVTPAGGEGLVGAYAANGRIAIPCRYRSIDVIKPSIYREPWDFSDEVLQSREDLYLVRNAQGAAGVWSVFAEREIVPCEYDDIAVMNIFDKLRFVVHRKGAGVFVTRGFPALQASPWYDWIEEYSLTGAGVRGMGKLVGHLVENWGRGRPVYARRAGSGWRVYPSGYEIAEELYQARQPRTEPVQPKPHDAALRLLRESDDPRVHRKAFDMLEAVDDGNMSVGLILAAMLEDGIGCVADPARARAKYEQVGLPSVWGHPIANRNLGRCMLHGIGGPVDVEGALFRLDLAVTMKQFRDRYVSDPQACLYAGQEHARQARAAWDAGNQKAGAQALQRAVHYFRTMTTCGDDEGYLWMTRCHLGEFGSKPKPDAAHQALRQAMNSLRHEQAARDIAIKHNLYSEGTGEA